MTIIENEIFSEMMITNKNLYEKENMEVKKKYDDIPQAPIPFRRYFSRIFDISFYSVLCFCIAELIFKTDIASLLVSENIGNIFSTVLVRVLMLVIEPLFLCLFATTPGKAIFGIRVRDNNGRRLSYKKAFKRTFDVIMYGYGFFIPLVSIYRLWKSFKSCCDAETLDWEYDSELTVKDDSLWRIGVLFVSYGVLAFFVYLSICIALWPANRGELTKSKFVENYNGYADYYGGLLLDEEGQLSLDDPYDGIVSIYLFEPEYPTFEYTEDNDIVTEIRIVKDSDDSGYIIYYNEIIGYALMAYVRAGESICLNNSEVDKLISQIESNPLESFTCQIDNIEVRYDVEYSGGLEASYSYGSTTEMNPIFAWSFELKKLN